MFECGNQRTHVCVPSKHAQWAGYHGDHSGRAWRPARDSDTQHHSHGCCCPIVDKFGRERARKGERTCLHMSWEPVLTPVPIMDIFDVARSWLFIVNVTVLPLGPQLNLCLLSPPPPSEQPGRPGGQRNQLVRQRQRDPETLSGVCDALAHPRRSAARAAQLGSRSRSRSRSRSQSRPGAGAAGRAPRWASQTHSSPEGRTGTTFYHLDIKTPEQLVFVVHDVSGSGHCAFYFPLQTHTHTQADDSPEPVAKGNCLLSHQTEPERP